MNSISFHVRSLANVGILVEVPELAKDARERVWKLGPPTINADLDLLKDDAAYRTSASASIGLIYSEVERAITAAMAAGPETLAHSEATSLRLTRHQARALALRVHAVIEEFDDDPAAAAGRPARGTEPAARGWGLPAPERVDVACVKILASPILLVWLAAPPIAEP